MDGERGQVSTHLGDPSNITGDTAVEMAQKESFSSLSLEGVGQGRALGAFLNEPLPTSIIQQERHVGSLTGVQLSVWTQGLGAAREMGC